MAKQEGIVQFTGRIGNLSFFRMKDGTYAARRKSGVSPERIKKDPKFALVRANGREFGQATRASKLIRTAFLPLMKDLADGSTSQRLNALCKAIIKTDALNEAGNRLLTDGEIEKFENFEFNTLSPLDTSFFAQFTTAFDRTAGSATISIPAFIPDQMVQFPSNATHFRLKAGAAALNFEKGKFVNAQAAIDPLLVDKKLTEPINLTMPLPAGTTDALFLTLGIDFLQEEHGRLYEVHNSMYSAMKIVAADVQA